MQAILQRNKWITLIQYFLLACVCLPLLSGCESRKIIVNSLDEREANEILVYLSTKGIDAVKVKNEGGGGGGGSKIVLWDISVNAEQGLEAMSMLNQAGLPRRRSQNLLNIFTGSGLVPSEMEQKIRYQAGLAEQIASTIRKIDGILDAEVQISFPEEDPLNPNAEKKQKITASVYVKHNGVLDDPNSHLVTKMKRLVAAGVPGLDFDYVTVIGEKARFTDLPSPSSLAGGEDKQYVNVWTVTVAKDSLSRFRIIFFSFVLFILIVLLLLAWMTWKVHLVLKDHGGMQQLFHLKPIQIEKKVEEKAPEEAEKTEKTSEESKSLVDKDVDNT